MQREVLRSRHYVLKFLVRRGFVHRAGTNWTHGHFDWLRSLLRDGSLGPEDRSVFGEYFALLDSLVTRLRRSKCLSAESRCQSI